MKECHLQSIRQREDFPGGSVVKNTPTKAGHAISMPELGRSPGGGNDNPLHYSFLENPMDRGEWWSRVQGVSAHLTQLNKGAKAE